MSMLYKVGAGVDMCMFMCIYVYCLNVMERHKR